MAYIINTAIPTSNFELVRDRIATILADEIARQRVLQSNADLECNIYVERHTPISYDEGNVIIVSVMGGTFSQQTEVTQKGEFDYAIDIYTFSKQTNSNDGYYLSTAKLHKYVGLIRNIIQSPYYNRLLFANGIVYGRSITQLQIARADDNKDATFSRFGRLILKVGLHCESPAITSTVVVQEVQSVFKIEDTEKGYKLINNNS